MIVLIIGLISDLKLLFKDKILDTFHIQHESIQRWHHGFITLKAGHIQTNMVSFLTIHFWDHDFYAKF